MQLHWLLPEIKGVPVLMYHRVWPGQRDGLTVTPEDLREQWTWLRDEGYTCLTMERFIRVARGLDRAPKKSFLLTFDDGYRNNLTYVLPLLQEFGWEATIFIIAGTVDGTYDLGHGIDEHLSVEELRQMAGDHICLGLHGYRHENFKETPIKDIKELMQQSINVLEAAGIPFTRVLAYPYGARPKKGDDPKQLRKRLSALEVKAAFRIGNKPQVTPASNMYDLNRIDIRGGDTLETFKIKLRKGKLKPF
jgi:peptidoglycan/xylan/chitin deacetylase (PgdA/CDA1 family)